MISQITIKNIALIDELTIHFDEGFNVLTGETGAGKSIIIDAVNLALGERADRELIQTGKDYARVELLFSLINSLKVNELLSGYGIDPESDGSLLLMRELTNQGKNVCRINGRTVTLSMLKEVSSYLVDIHGQHQHQSLLNPESHITFLDRLGGTALDTSKIKLREIYGIWQGIRKEINKIIGLNKDGERRKDILQYQIEEIQKAQLISGEEENLRKERAVLIHAEKITNTVNNAYQELYTGHTGIPSLSDSLAKIINSMQGVQNIDDSLDIILKQLEGLQYQLEDSVLHLRAYKDDFEYDPDRLEIIESRLELMHNLKRKYGSTVDEVLLFKENMEDELYLLENSQEKLESLQQQYKSIYKDILKQCADISGIRKRCAKAFEKELLMQLSDLNMEKTKFNVSIETPIFNNNEEPDVTGISNDGYDRVEFLISPNPGEPLKPLAKIISGGEMSRVMLAFKTILGDMDEIPTMIFDEIDVGISGRTAQSVAEKIGAISRGHQIICITHLPQIASMADNHFIIEKVTLNDHTRTMVSRLELPGRQQEVARMIGGASLTPLSLEHAGELIKSAIIHKTKTH
ncbi:MAG: DNA repair protein RecN [Firmicutes bacterium]|nr:DNA repair protein RecN [Bacillota bacterium]